MKLSSTTSKGGRPVPTSESSDTDSDTDTMSADNDLVNRHRPPSSPSLLHPPLTPSKLDQSHRLWPRLVRYRLSTPHSSSEHLPLALNPERLTSDRPTSHSHDIAMPSGTVPHPATSESSSLPSIDFQISTVECDFSQLNRGVTVTAQLKSQAS